MTVILLLPTKVCYSEATVWDCPECGRTGNTANFCGACAHPAPWIESIIDSTQDFKTVGSFVTFGHYEQDHDINNGAEEIEWIVLDYDEANQKTLLLSRYGLDTVPYNKELIDITWGECSLRDWLNSEFLDQAFSIAEQSAILTTMVDNSSNQGYDEWNTEGGFNTKDKVFLLSYAEANRYLGVTYTDHNNIKSRASTFVYAKSQGNYLHLLTADGLPAVSWWLRSPGTCQFNAACVRVNGSLNCFRVDNKIGEIHYVRPVLWLNLDSDGF